MPEPQYVYRIAPCPAYDLPGMESWLEDQAAKGYHLSTDGFFLGVATFEAGPPRAEKFRLEATATNGSLFSREYAPNDDAIQIHHQMGWTYRARRGQFHIYSSSDPEAPELHTDPRVQAITIASLGKYQCKNLYQTLLLMTLYALTLYGDMVVTAAVTVGSWWAALVLGLLIWHLAKGIGIIVKLSKLRRQLQNGSPLPHRSDYRRGRCLYPITNAVFGALTVFAIGYFLLFAGTHMNGQRAVKLEQWDAPFPFATLEDLYPGSQVHRMDGILKSQVTGWSDFLAPENYDYSEYARVTVDGQPFECYLKVHYHRTRYEWTAAILARELISQTGANGWEQFAAKLFGQEPVVATELALPGADYAAYYYLHRSEPWLVLRQGKIVVRVNLDLLGSGAGLEPEALAQAVLSQIR